MTKTSNSVLTVLLALVLGTGMAMAQHNHGGMTDPSPSIPNSPTSRDMIQSCQKHGAESMAALDKLDKTITTGRESENPAKMKAALDTAHEQLAEARHHMSMCPMMSGGDMQKGDMGMDHMDHMKSTPNESEHQ